MYACPRLQPCKKLPPPTSFKRCRNRLRMSEATCFKSCLLKILQNRKLLHHDLALAIQCYGADLPGLGTLQLRDVLPPDISGALGISTSAPM